MYLLSTCVKIKTNVFNIRIVYYCIALHTCIMLCIVLCIVLYLLLIIYIKMCFIRINCLSSHCFFQVHGWEPPMTYDILPLRWGKLADMAISGDQLVCQQLIHKFFPLEKFFVYFERGDFLE